MAEPTPPHWQLQEAKQRFSEVIRAVERDGPQIITRHGEDVAVIDHIAERPAARQPAVDLRTSPVSLAFPGKITASRSMRLSAGAAGNALEHRHRGSDPDPPRRHLRHFRGPQAQSSAKRDPLDCGHPGR